MVRPVLAGVDGSTESEAAVHWAAEEAERRGTALRLVHSWPWETGVLTTRGGRDDLREAASRMLAHAQDEARARHPGLVVDTALVSDDVVEGLVSVAHDGAVLVLGSRGLGGFAGLLVGSVSLAVTARVDVPVVLVRPPAETAPTAPGREVVVGLDAYYPAAPVLEFAFTEAALHGVPLRAVHGWELLPAFPAPGWIPPQVDTAELQAYEVKQLSQALVEWRGRFPDTEVVEDVRLGGGAAALVGASAGAVLVVVGRRTRQHGFGARMGSVTHAVIHHAKAPTAVVPHP